MRQEYLLQLKEEQPAAVEIKELGLWVQRKKLERLRAKPGWSARDEWTWSAFTEIDAKYASLLEEAKTKRLAALRWRDKESEYEERLQSIRRGWKFTESDKKGFVLALTRGFENWKAKNPEPLWPVLTVGELEHRFAEEARKEKTLVSNDNLMLHTCTRLIKTTHSY
jgi:hypothetical protein